MDNRLFRIFLTGVLALTGFSAPVLAADEDTTDRPPVIAPDIVRLGLKEADIDTYDVEVGGYVGYMSIEDFGTHPVYGVRGAWHVTEDLFVEAQYGLTDGGKTISERYDSSLRLLSDSDRRLTYYNLSLGFNALPGEVFIGSNHAFNVDFYVLAGAGTTHFAGDSMFTINVGGGLRFIVTDWLAVHIMMQDLIFEKNSVMDPARTGDSAHNLQYTTSLTAFF